MNPEEAVRRCEFWTTVESQALGSTRDPEIGAYFNGDDVAAEQFSNPQGARIWAISISRYLRSSENLGQLVNPLYEMIEREIERRHQ